MKVSIGLLIGCLLVGLVFAQLAAGTTMAKPEAQFCSVESDGSGTHATIQAAASDINCDVLEVGSGTFNEVVTIHHSMTIQGQGVATSAVDGGEAGSVFTINPGLAATIRNLMITGGKANYGGGIHSSGRLTVTNSMLSGNQAAEGGGGIYSSYNVITPIDDPSLVLDRVVVNNNTARYSAGINAGCNSALIRQSTINGNISANDHMSGGVGQSCAQGNMRILGSTISNNHAGGGAGITFSGDRLEVINSTISENTAPGQAVAISTCCNDVEAILRNTTVSGNIGGSGGALRGWFTLVNTIVAWNGPNNCEGQITSQGYNLASDYSCNFFQASDLQGTNPYIGPLQDNGGSTFTRALQEASPAIDAGDDTACPATDQRGLPRPQDGDEDGTAACDIGAYELVRNVIGLTANCTTPTILGQSTMLTATVLAGSNVAYIWDFGDETTGTGGTSTHIYADPGTYTAVVTASNSISSLTATTSVVVEEAITGLAVGYVSPVSIGQESPFSATVANGSNVDFYWDFGDTFTATGSVVAHTYAAVDEYVVTVMAINQVSSETKGMIVYVKPAEIYLPVILHP